MKKSLLSSAIIAFSLTAYSQSGEKWATGLNASDGTDALGTNNNFPLIIKTNNTERLRVKETGELLLNNVAGYAADYSSLFTARSLVDKTYVDNSIATAIGGIVFPPSLWSAGAGQYSIMNNLQGSNSSQAQYSFIAAGNNNSIFSNAQYGVILGGDHNQIQNIAPPSDPLPIHNMIGSGSGNIIQHNANYSVILAGQNNIMDDHFSLILNGTGNVIEAPTVQSSYNMISNGVNNRIKSNANYSTIIGGRDNTIAPGVFGSVILGSNNITATQPNTVYLTKIAFPDGSQQTTAASSLLTAGSGQYAVMNNLAGTNNAQAQYSFIGAGNNNIVQTNARFGAILAGENNQIQNFVAPPPGSEPIHNMIVSGSGNIIQHNARYSFIAGGQNNVLNDDYSTILGGVNNSILSSASLPPDSYNLITGGVGNSIQAQVNHSSIIGGTGNTVSSGVNNAVILGGTNINATQSNTVYMNKITVTSLAGSGDRVMMIDANGNLKTLQSGSSTFWAVAGNTGTTPGTDFVGTTDVQDLVFKTNGEEHMRITSTGDHPGNVGIGTNDPEKKLHVVTTHTACATCPQTHEGIRLEDQMYAPPPLPPNATNPTINAWDIQPFGGNALAIRKPGQDPLMTVLNNGNVGLGNLTPTNKLDVIGNGKFSGSVSIGTTAAGGRVQIEETAFDQPALVAGDLGAHSIWLVPKLSSGPISNHIAQPGDAGILVGDHFPNASNQGFIIGPAVATMAGLRVDPTGKVSINQSNPQSTLDVRGDVRFTSLTAATTDYIEIDNFSINSHNTTPFVGLSINASSGKPVIIGNSTSSTSLLSVPCKAKFEGQVIIGNANGIGGTHGDFDLAVAGKIVSKSSYVTVTSWQDAVFADDYNLLPLEKVEEYYTTNKHLPDYPAEKEIVNNGLDLGSIAILQQKSIEEIMLYLVDMKKEMTSLKEKNTILENEIQKLKIK